jgi:two-component system response regulator YesN
MSEKDELLTQIKQMDEKTAALVLAYAKSLQKEQNALPAQKTRRQNDVLTRLKLLRQEVQANPEKWTVDAMAEAFRLTRSRFSVLYKQTFGAAPGDEKRAFLNQKARSLLSDTEKTVQQVAAECGYNECENFIRAFRKSNGMSPLQYRRTRT